MNKERLTKKYFIGKNGKYNASPEDIISLMRDVEDDAKLWKVSKLDAFLGEMLGEITGNNAKESDEIRSTIKSDRDVFEYLEWLAGEITEADAEANDYYESVMWDYRHTTVPQF